MSINKKNEILEKIEIFLKKLNRINNKKSKNNQEEQNISKEIEFIEIQLNKKLFKNIDKVIENKQNKENRKDKTYLTQPNDKKNKNILNKSINSKIKDNFNANAKNLSHINNSDNSETVSQDKIKKINKLSKEEMNKNKIFKKNTIIKPYINEKKMYEGIEYPNKITYENKNYNILGDFKYYIETGKIYFICKYYRYKSREFVGKKKPCYSKILYDTTNKEFKLINPHSKFCDELTEPTNILLNIDNNLETELINYNKFREVTLNF